MSFAARDLSVLAYANGFTLWHFTTTDASVATLGYFDTAKVERLVKKIEKGRAIGNKDNMALVGILSTQVWHFHFIENYFKNFS